MTQRKHPNISENCVQLSKFLLKIQLDFFYIRWSMRLAKNVYKKEIFSPLTYGYIKLPILDS